MASPFSFIRCAASLLVATAVSAARPAFADAPPASATPAPQTWIGCIWYQPYEKIVRMDSHVGARLPRQAEDLDGTMTVEITDAGGKSVWKQDWRAKNILGTQAKLDLPTGDYVAHATWRSSQNEVQAEFSNPVPVKNYAFMHNGIGEERIVVPPFTKITASGATAAVWGRTFTFGDNGLPKQINAVGKDLLDGAVRVVLRRDGKAFDLKPGQKFAIQTADGYDATGSSSGKVGGLDYHLDGRLEYDGTYFIKLVVEGKGIDLDSLALEISLAQVDTFSAQKNDRDIGSSGGFGRFMGIKPGQTGVLFDARDLPSKSAYGIAQENSFIPSIYAGTGTRGLWFYADNEWDWYLNPAKEQDILERKDGATILRIPFVNDHITWSGKRTIEFALMPQPVKPMATGWRKIAWGYPTEQYLHDTSGWRYYGDGLDAFTLPTDADYENLAKVVSGQAPPAPNTRPGVLLRKPGDPRPMVFYGSGLMAGGGVAQGEWDSFGAEWAGPAWVEAGVDRDTKSRFDGKASWGGYTWTQDISFRPSAAMWTDSWLDFFLYYNQKLAKIVGMNGTFFDNQSSFVSPMYDDNGLQCSLEENPNRFPVTPHPAGYGCRYHIFQFRALLKRLVTMDYVNGVQPFWMTDQHPTRSFAQIAWHVESDYYTEHGQRDLVEHYGGPGQGLAGFRAHVRTMGGVIDRLQSARSDRIIPVEAEEEGRSSSSEVRLTDAPEMLLPGVARTHVAMCLATDIGTVGAADDPQTKLTLSALDKEFGFFDDDVQFTGYWDQQSVKAPQANVYISLFSHKSANKVLAVVFNENKDSVVADLGIAPKIDGVPARTVRDIETGEPLVDLRKGTAGFQTKLFIPGRNMRLVLISGESAVTSGARAQASR